MKTVALDLVVREALMDAGLPIHYYFDYLHHGIRALEELNYDTPLNVKSVELSVTDYQRAVLPSDCVAVVDVSGRHGEYLVPFAQDRQLNKLYNFDSSGDKIVYPETTDTSNLEEILYTSLNYATHISNNGEHMGRFYGSNTSQTQTYGIDKINSELVFSNSVNVTLVVLTYVTDGLSTSSANLVTPEIKDYIQKYCHYKRVQYGNYPMNQKALAKQESVLAEKKARARIFSQGYADLIRSIRRGLHASIKN